MNAEPAIGVAAISTAVSVGVVVAIAAVCGMSASDVCQMAKIAVAVAVPLNALIAVFVVRSR